MNYVGPSSAVPELTKPRWRMRRINVTKQVLVTPALIPPLTHSLDVWTNSNDQSMSFSNCDTSESLSVTISDNVCSLQKRVRDVKYSWIICKYCFVCAQCHVQKRDIKYWWIIEWHLSQLWIHGLLYDTSKWHRQLSILVKVALFHILTSISFIFGSCVDRITIDSLIHGSHLQMTLTIIRWGGGYRKEKAQCYIITSHFLTAITSPHILTKEY